MSGRPRLGRVSEMRALLGRMSDPDLAVTLAVPEYGLTEGYELWSKTCDAPLRLFVIEQGLCMRCSPPGQQAPCWVRSAAPGGTASTLRRRAIGSSASIAGDAGQGAREAAARRFP
jgi:hypothetical protein